MSVLRVEYEPIDVTLNEESARIRGRQYAQGLPTYYIDGEEVDEATFKAAWCAADGHRWSQAEYPVWPTCERCGQRWPALPEP